MKYRNIETGVVVDIPSKLNSKVWELVAPEPTKQEEDSKPKTRRKASK